MPQIPLIGGYYVARSVIANAQRCLNLYPEKNPQDAEAPVTHYLTPGLTVLIPGALQLPWRALFFASNQVLYGVLGTNVYSIDSNWNLTLLGIIPSKNTPVSMKDNGIVLVIVDGSALGWKITLATNVFAQIVDPNFLGSDFVGYADTFFIFNQPGTKNIYSSLSNSITFDPTYIAAKTGNPDTLIATIVNHVEIWAIGRETTEVWANTGSTGLPYARVPGVFIQHGCVAKYSVASYNLQIFWLSQDNNGQAIILLGESYRVRSISTPAISDAIGKYNTISDAQGFVYQQGTHVFYILTFPTADKTWVYDLSTGLWHERCFIDDNGIEHRIRANCTAFAYGKNVVGDWQNGNLYSLDLSNNTDNGYPIMRRRGFPHIVTDGKTAYHSQFIANMETGAKLNEGGVPVMQNPFEIAQPAAEATIYLRWSDDRGNSWGEPIAMSLGATGEYTIRPSWRDLGISFDRVYELFWSDDATTALNGAYLDLQPLAV